MKARKTILLCAGAPQASLEQDLAQLNLLNSDRVLTIGVDRGAWELLRHFETIDWAIGDFDSVTLTERLSIESSSQEFNCFPPEKDQTDLELALDKIIERYEGEEVEAIYLFACLGIGGRLSHLLANLYTIYQKPYQALVDKMIFCEKNLRGKFYWPGDYLLANSRMANHYVSFIMMADVSALTLKGSKYEVFQRDYPVHTTLISNEFIQGQAIQLSFDKGLIFVLEEWEI